MTPHIHYFLRLELAVLAAAFVLGLIYYFAYGLVPALRIGVGIVLLANVALAWVFRASLIELVRKALGR
jgi:hypothetical protein